MNPRLTLAVLLLVPSLAGAKPDKPGCADHALFSRMSGFYLHGCQERAFDAYKFRVADGKRYREEAVEGRFLLLNYSFEGTPRPSALQWVRNYQNAARQAGGTVLYDGESRTTLRIVRGGSEVWVDAANYGSSFTLAIVERQAMVQEVKANAAALQSALAADGHAAVGGIFFDTGLAVVKPESGPALAEIARLLASEKALKVRVIGHTDSTGALEANLKLSQARAEAVVQELTTQHQVAPDRLTAHGVGPLAPAASNRTEEGRTRNRRVELVEQ
jgi:outer membrane protein OmpA-like peptidoglycan-associated protein